VIVANRVHLEFLDYARTMLPAALAASVAVSLVLGVLFRHALRSTIDVSTDSPGLTDRRIAYASAVATSAALVGFAVFPDDLGVVAFVAGGAAAVVLLVSRVWSRRRAALATGPRLLVFALATFVMVDAVERHGLRSFVERHRPGSAGGVGLVAGALSNLVNNLPATIIGLPLAGADPHRAYALLAGVDAGPNLTLAGSLATLLWLAAVREHGSDVRPLRYLSIGVLTAPVGLAAALATLALLR
jgi:arsenical pump membrane protein